MNQQIKQLHLEILALCFAVKEKGHDAFYNYSGHVDFATVNIYLDGWDWDSSKPDITFDFLPTKEYDLKLNNCKDYLQNLLDGST